MKHNKLPEYLFGQLDQLMPYRPNATILTNESFIMYSHNTTRSWLDSLSAEEQNKLLTDSKKEGRAIRLPFQQRILEIKMKRQEQLKKQEELERLERVRVQKNESLTNLICYYGLWQSIAEIDEGLDRLPSDVERRKALATHLKFRKSILKQKHPEKEIYNFSRRLPTGIYEKLSTNGLNSNLLELVRNTLRSPTHDIAY